MHIKNIFTRKLPYNIDDIHNAIKEVYDDIPNHYKKYLEIDMVVLSNLNPVDLLIKLFLVGTNSSKNAVLLPEISTQKTIEEIKLYFLNTYIRYLNSKDNGLSRIIIDNAKSLPDDIFISRDADITPSKIFYYAFSYSVIGSEELIGDGSPVHCFYQRVDCEVKHGGLYFPN